MDTVHQGLDPVHGDFALFFFFSPFGHELVFEGLHLVLRFFLSLPHRFDFLPRLLEHFVVLRHVECCLLHIVDISSAMEQGELFFVFLLVDLVESKLVEIFKEPGAFEGIAAFGAEDVAAGDCEAG